MTPARKAALQWYHDNPEAALVDHHFDKPAPPSRTMAARMVRDGELELSHEPAWYHDSGAMMVFLEKHNLTDLGRRRLNGDDV